MSVMTLLQCVSGVSGVTISQCVSGVISQYVSDDCVSGVTIYHTMSVVSLYHWCHNASVVSPGSVHSSPLIVKNHRIQQMSQLVTLMFPFHVTLSHVSSCCLLIRHSCNRQTNSCTTSSVRCPPPPLASPWSSTNHNALLAASQ